VQVALETWDLLSWVSLEPVPFRDCSVSIEKWEGPRSELSKYSLIV
jgi:hypothetical protein